MRFAQAPPTKAATTSASKVVGKAATTVYVTLAAQVLSLGALVVFEQVRGRQLAAELAEFGGRPSGPDADALAERGDGVRGAAADRPGHHDRRRGRPHHVAGACPPGRRPARGPEHGRRRLAHPGRQPGSAERCWCTRRGGRPARRRRAGAAGWPW
ncbi:hypothetical protein ACFSTC_10725 [Nonomuraea ferruginea]